MTNMKDFCSEDFELCAVLKIIASVEVLCHASKEILETGHFVVFKERSISYTL